MHPRAGCSFIHSLVVQNKSKCLDALKAGTHGRTVFISFFGVKVKGLWGLRRDTLWPEQVTHSRFCESQNATSLC